MKIDIVPSFAKSICKRVAAAVHSFAHPKELHELQKRERSLARELVDARQNEEYANYCVSQFRERAEQSEEVAEFYKRLFRREHRLRAEEVCSPQHRGFENGYGQRGVDSAYGRDGPNHSEGGGDGYAPRMDHEVGSLVQRTDNGGHSPDDIKHGDSICKDNLQGETLHDDNLHGPKEMGSPSDQPTLDHSQRSKRHPKFWSPCKPFFPCRAHVKR